MSTWTVCSQEGRNRERSQRKEEEGAGVGGTQVRGVVLAVVAG